MVDFEFLFRRTSNFAVFPFGIPAKKFALRVCLHPRKPLFGALGRGNQPTKNTGKFMSFKLQNFEDLELNFW